MHFVIAGTGYTGARLLNVLDGAAGISRSQPPGLPPARSFIRDLDVARIEPLEITTRCSMVYTIPPAANSPEDRRLSRLLNALRPAARRIVYLSTSGIYGDQQGALTNESVPPEPMNGRAKRRLAAEQQLLEHCSQNNCEVVILRVPGIYGPGRLGLERIQAGSPVIAEEAANPGNRIHVDDLVRCCIAALRPETPAGIYNVGDGDFRSSTWFTATVARLAGYPAPPQISRASAEATFSPARLSFLQEARRLDTTKMQAGLGVELSYGNPQDGIRASLLEDGLLKT